MGAQFESAGERRDIDIAGLTVDEISLEAKQGRAMQHMAVEKPAETKPLGRGQRWLMRADQRGERFMAAG